jgi:UPF0755 protein
MLVKAMRMNIPVKLAFNNQERVENFAGRVGSLRQIVFRLTSFKDSIFLRKTVLPRKCIGDVYSL